MRRSMFGVLAVAVLAGAMIFGMALAANTVLTTTLSGANEVPGPGDADGGCPPEPHAEEDEDLLRGQRAEHRVGYHGPHTKAPAGDAGGIVRGLKAPTDGSSMGCVRASRALIRDMKNDPDGYYINVHDDDFPNGAVRGQLTASP